MLNYSSVLDEIDKIGWQKLISVNHDFTEMKLKMQDSLNHEHILKVKLNNGLPEFSTDFPRSMTFEWHEVIMIISLHLKFKYYTNYLPFFFRI